MIVKTDCETDGSYAALLLLTCSVSVVPAVPADRRVKYVYLPVELWMDTDRKMSPSLDLKRGRKQAARCPRQCPLVACGGRAAAWRRPAAGPSLGSRPQCRLSHSRCQPPVCSRSPPASASLQWSARAIARHIKHSSGSCPRHESLHEPAYYCDTHQR